MKKAPIELKRFAESETGGMYPVPFADAIEDGIIFQVHIWIKRELAKNPHSDVYWTLHRLEEWLGKPEGYEKLEDMV